MSGEVYFLYSDEQIREKNLILSKTSRKKRFIPGVVTVGHEKRKFSQLSKNPTIPRFPDAVIVASGDISKFTYVMPETEYILGENTL